MASDENSFFGLKVPEGNDRRELYKSQYRAIYTYKMGAQDLDQAFREAVTSDGPDGGWSIKNDERVKYVGKLEVAKGEDSTLKARALAQHYSSAAWPGAQSGGVEGPGALPARRRRCRGSAPGQRS
jgi:hypothetical protein